MYTRTKAEGLNPRFLLHDVLSRVLITYADDLKTGHFPSWTLHQDFGGLSDRWGPEAQRAIEYGTTPTHAPRHKALLDLWTTKTQPVRLSEVIYEAFNLANPSYSEGLDSNGKPTIISTDPKPTEQLPAKIRRLLISLDDWSRGTRLSQTATNDLRKALYAAVRSRIEWDTERLIASLLAQATGSGFFRQTSINFHNQATTVKASEVSLELPLPNGPNRTDTALALKGLVLYQHYRNWEFEKAADRLLDYACLLESVADEIVRQLRNPANKAWDPALAAAELLVLGATLHGNPSSTKTSSHDRLNAMFTNWKPIKGEEASSEWIKLTNLFAEKQEPLCEILEAYSLCAKGGARQTKFLDTARFVHVLKRINLLPLTKLPSNLPKRLRVLTTLQSSVNQQFTHALKTEQARWSKWSTQITAWFGSASLKDVNTAVQNIRQYLDTHGLQRLSRRELDQFDRISSRIRERDMIQLRPLARRIVAAETDSDTQKSVLARDIGHAVSLGSSAQHIQEYGRLTELMLEKADTFLKNQSEKN